MCANVLIWGDSEPSAVRKISFLNGPSYAIALATYAHFNTRLTGRQCGGLCCATQRRDSPGENFCLIGDVFSQMWCKGLVAWTQPWAGAAPTARLGRKVTGTYGKWKPLHLFIWWEAENLGNPCRGAWKGEKEAEKGRKEGGIGLNMLNQVSSWDKISL